MIRAMIVDDERPAIGLLANLLRENGVEVIGEYINPYEALKSIKDAHCDIAFLDIEMPGIDGLDLAHQMLDLSGNTHIVFVTAYNEYAIEAFKLNAMDYLMKPVSLDRLQITLERVVNQSLHSHIESKSQLNIRCFCKFKVVRGAEQIMKWRTSKTEELFAFLIDKNGKEVGKDKILDVIWRGFDEKRALTNFNTTLYNMRKALREIGYLEILICSNGMYRLDMNQIHSDIGQFESCVSQSEPINQQSIAQYEQVIELCNEGYFEQNYYEWAQARSRLIEEEYIGLIIRTAVYYKSNELGDKAEDILKKGLLRDALHPQTNLELMKLYLQMNKHYAALKHYEGYKWKLKKELDIRPDQEMMALRRKLNSAE